MVRCADGSLYTGIAMDVVRRVQSIIRVMSWPPTIRVPTPGNSRLPGKTGHAFGGR